MPLKACVRPSLGATGPYVAVPDARASPGLNWRNRNIKVTTLYHGHAHISANANVSWRRPPSTPFRSTYVCVPQTPKGHPRAPSGGGGVPELVTYSFKRRPRRRWAVVHTRLLPFAVARRTARRMSLEEIMLSEAVQQSGSFLAFKNRQDLCTRANRGEKKHRKEAVDVLPCRWPHLLQPRAAMVNLKR